MRTCHHLTAEFIAAITALGASAAVAMQVESYLLRVLEPVERRRRAAELLPKLGAAQTARVEHCCRATVYNRNRRQRRMKIV